MTKRTKIQTLFFILILISLVYIALDKFMGECLISISSLMFNLVDESDLGGGLGFLGLISVQVFALYKALQLFRKDKMFVAIMLIFMVLLTFIPIFNGCEY